MKTKSIKKPVLKKTKSVVKKLFRPKIRSRHGSHDNLRTMLPRMPFTSVIRFGSTTPVNADIQINLPESILNSADKLRMKNCFLNSNVKTANWIYLGDSSEENLSNFIKNNGFPLVLKSRFGSRGRGNYLIKSKEELDSHLSKISKRNYILEKYYSFNKEYRLHVTEDGCFYTCRKVLRKETPEDKRWFKNDSNSNWLREDNEMFDKPLSWDKIVVECVKALNSCNLDFGACDVRVQSSKDNKDKVRKDPDFVIIEINSAPSFGELTEEHYLRILPDLLNKKFLKTTNKTK